MRYISQLSFKPQLFLVSWQMLSLSVHVAMQFHLLGQFLYSRIILNERRCREAQCREDCSGLYNLMDVQLLDPGKCLQDAVWYHVCGPPQLRANSTSCKTWVMMVMQGLLSYIPLVNSSIRCIWRSEYVSCQCEWLIQRLKALNKSSCYRLSHSGELGAVSPIMAQKVGYKLEKMVLYVHGWPWS